MKITSEQCIPPGMTLDSLKQIRRSLDSAFLMIDIENVKTRRAVLDSRDLIEKWAEWLEQQMVANPNAVDFVWHGFQF